MIVLVGESGSGKTTIREELVKYPKYTKAISCTTRLKRMQEVEGEDYQFLTIEDFERKTKDTYFAEYAEYNGCYYGLPLNQIAKNKVTIVEPVGVENLKHQFGRKIVIFYLKASENTRRTRMIERGDSLEVIEKRLLLDRERFSDIKGLVDFTIDTENKTVKEIIFQIRILYNNEMNSRRFE